MPVKPSRNVTRNSYPSSASTLDTRQGVDGASYGYPPKTTVESAVAASTLSIFPKPPSTRYGTTLSILGQTAEPWATSRSTSLGKLLFQSQLPCPRTSHENEAADGHSKTSE